MLMFIVALVIFLLLVKVFMAPLALYLAHFGPGPPKTKDETEVESAIRQEEEEQWIRNLYNDEEI